MIDHPLAKQTSNRYELINYSEHGTIVDSVLFSLDLSKKKCHDPEAFRRKKKAKPVDKVPVTAKPVVKWSLRQRVKEEQELIEKNEKEEKDKKLSQTQAKSASTRPEPQKPPPTTISSTQPNVQRVPVKIQSMNPNAGKILEACCCRASPSIIIGGNGAGWEGSAILNHGSHIRMGCLEFVFSITSYGQVAASGPQSASLNLSLSSPSRWSNMSSSSSTISATSTPSCSQLTDISSQSPIPDS